MADRFEPPVPSPKCSRRETLNSGVMGSCWRIRNSGLEFEGVKDGDALEEKYNSVVT